MPDTSSKTDRRKSMTSLWALFGRGKSAEELPEKLLHRMKRMERDLSKRLPDRGMFKS